MKRGHSVKLWEKRAAEGFLAYVLEGCRRDLDGAQGAGVRMGTEWLYSGERAWGGGRRVDNDCGAVFRDREGVTTGWE
jgi:hypothetical protein